MSERPQRVCFAALGAYPLFNAGCRFPFGGSELRAATFARGLAADAAFSVDVLVFDHGQPALEQHGALRLHAHPHFRIRNSSRPAAFVRSLGRRARTAFGRMRALDHRIDPEALAPYERLDPDVLCVFGIADMTAELAAYCRAAGRRLLVFLGSDSDVSERYVPGDRSRNDYGSRRDLCHYALTAADAIIAQTETQARHLTQRFGRRATVIANPVFRAAAAPAARRDRVLWVGKSDAVKRPELFVELARRRPGLRFTMVLNRADEAAFASLAATLPANVELIDWASVDETEALFARSFALVNTSRFEGFPNTFLQAGAHGVPILSLSVDPDGFIERLGCGRVAGGSLELLLEGLDQAADPAAFARMSAAVNAYVASHHAAEEKTAELKGVLQTLGLRTRPADATNPLDRISA